MPTNGRTPADASGFFTSDSPTVLAPTLNTNWADYGSGFSNAGYYKDQFGWVGLRGLVKTTTTVVTGLTGAVAFTLPAAYRPAAGTRYFTVHSYGTDFAGTTWLSVNASTGNVCIGTRPVPANSQPPQTFLYASLEGIYFPTADAFTPPVAAGAWGTRAADTEPGVGLASVAGNGSGVLGALAVHQHPMGFSLLTMDAIAGSTAANGSALFSYPRASVFTGYEVFSQPATQTDSTDLYTPAVQRLDLRGSSAVVETQGVTMVGGSAPYTSPSVYGHMWDFDASRTNAPGTLAASATFPNTAMATPASTRVRPTLINSWANVGGQFENAWYQKIGNRVWLGGLVRNGTDGSVIFTLPAGFRPGARTLFSSAGATASVVPGTRVDVFGNGDVVAPTNGSTNTYLSLAGISFLAEA